jgi:RND family efflux transporter MFP subunit
MMHRFNQFAVGSALVAAVAAVVAATGCSSSPDAAQAAPVRVSGSVYTVKATVIDATFEASGTAEPLRQATLSTKLMGTVDAVLVKEGDAVVAGQPLVRLDARDLAAKQNQLGASIADAEAQRREAATHAGRMRALYADSAATKAQLDAAETGLARSEAGVRAARAASAELDAMSSYAVIRAPFAGLVTKRFVDPGAFAAPGAPLIAVQDGLQLRVTANATPDMARSIHRGQTIGATIEGRPVGAIVEGVVPSSSANLYDINAVVANPGGHFLPGSTATLFLPMGVRHALMVPTAAVLHQGDLTGVTLRTAEGDQTRWVRLGVVAGNMVEVNAGLRAGDQVIVPVAGVPVAGGN